MPVPDGPVPMSTMTSPSRTDLPGDSLDRLDRVALVGEHPGRTAMPIDAVAVDHRWVDGGRLDDRSLRREVAERKRRRCW